jgi:hypothetical protein
MRRSLSALFAGLLLASLYCTGQIAGGGTETTNGISGTIALTGDSASGGAFPLIAAIYSIDYRPDSGTGVAETTLVGTNGAFHFDPPQENRYNLFVWDTSSRQGAYRARLPADTAVGTIALTETGILITTGPHGVGAVPGRSYELAIEGSPYFYKAESANFISIPMLPQGEYQVNLHIIPLDGVTDTPTIVNVQKSIIIDPAVSDTTMLEMP